MTFDEAKDFRMPFGAYKGKALDEIATTDEGLRYLDYLLGETDARVERRWVVALEAYLMDASIQKELEAL